MPISKWLVLLLIVAGVWLFLAPTLSITGSTFTVLLFTFSILLLLKWFKPTSKFVSAIPIVPKWAGIIGIVILLFGIFSYGWFSFLGLQQMFPTGAITTIPGAVTPAGTVTTCAAMRQGGTISDDIFGTSSTLTVNAWDMESNTPYSAAVDLTTNCWIYKNGNAASNFIAASTDTSAASVSGFSVGNKVYVYCGGTTYYTDPYEGVCVDTQAMPVSLSAHTATTEANTDITGYDKTGATALTSGTSSEDDYTMAMGADADEIIYVQVQNNVANKKKNICALGAVRFYNISKVEPQSFTFEGKTYTWTATTTPLHMQGVDVQYNETSAGALTKDYTVYKLSEPINMNEWAYFKIPVVIESDATNDPNGGGGTSGIDGFAILLKDCTWARGVDGAMYYDFYVHDTGQADVGINEAETSPLGGTNGIVAEVT